MRTIGHTLLELEPLLEELVHTHELQKGDVIALVASWIDIHAPEAIEQYVSGGIPQLYYGHRSIIYADDRSKISHNNSSSNRNSAKPKTKKAKSNRPKK
jgi:hypothetical protein